MMGNLRVGTVGTSKITQQFIQACLNSSAFQVKAVYSRTLARAQALITQAHLYEASAYQSYDAMLADTNLDVIYIASPNSLHFQQAQAAIRHDKHVIVEKPAFLNPKQYAIINQLLAEHPSVRLIEAARHIYEPSFSRATAQIKKFDHIDGAVLTYRKYSSRYDDFKLAETGAEPPIFSPDFGGGALYDLGVYVVYAALIWFGVPQNVEYDATLAKNGIDLNGVATLTYPNFKVSLIIGKNQQSFLASEVYAGHKTLWLNSLGRPKKVRLYIGTEVYQDLSGQAMDNPLQSELSAFASLLGDNQNQQWRERWNLAQQVGQVLKELRDSAGIVFSEEK